MTAPAGWLVLYERWQFDTNVLASVAIEIPALRPALAARIAAIDGRPSPVTEKAPEHASAEIEAAETR